VSRLCLELEPAQPVPNCRRTEADLSRDLPDGEAALDERAEPTLFQPAPWSSQLVTSRDQCVLVDPVRDGRWITAGLACDRGDRLSGVEFSR
jgi:hypothetical protein